MAWQKCKKKSKKWALCYTVNYFDSKPVKWDTFAAKHNSCLSSDFVKPLTVLMFSNSWFTQISIVSLRDIFIKSESTCKLFKYNVGSCSYIFSANWNESLTVYSILVKRFNMETKTYKKSLYAGVCKVNKIGQNGGEVLRKVRT